MPVAIYAPETGLLHDAGQGHPECPERLQAVLDRVRAMPTATRTFCESSPATREQAARVHGAAYLDRLESVRGKAFRFDADTSGNAHSVDAAYAAAGAACAMARDIVTRSAENGFALVRPPGHHAERDRAMGFCLLNSIAIAAEVAIHEHDVDRVLIIDWDVHHGNGTQHSFESRDDVLFVSSHRMPFYPGTGESHERGKGPGEGYTINLPLPAGAGDDVVLELYRNVLPDVFGRFRPGLVLVSAGFDAHVNDPLGGLRMTTSGFGELCKVVRDHTGGRMGLVLEGGYDTGSLADCVERCIEAMT